MKLFRRSKFLPDQSPRSQPRNWARQLMPMTMALPGVSLAVLVSDAAPSPLSLLLAVSPPVATRDGRAVCS